MLTLPHSFKVFSESKIFDPRDSSSASFGSEVLDATVCKPGDQWWMYLAGQPAGHGSTDLFSASLPPGAPLSPCGWALTRDERGELVPVADRTRSAGWDGRGGRHCPSYVRGWESGAWVERIYYAGSKENLWGPYSIGYLEWDGTRWVDQPEPVFVASEDWERGSVYEPNLVYFEGRWMLWYVAGSNFEDYIIQGFAESPDGRMGWTQHSIFAVPEMKMFDFCVCETANGFEAVYACVWLGDSEPPSGTGLWWCRAEAPSGEFGRWGEAVQIMTAEDHGWHRGPWKPSFAYEQNLGCIFFDGLYRTDDPGPFPFAFTLGCLELRSSS